MSILDRLFPSEVAKMEPMIRAERQMYYDAKDDADRRLGMLKEFDKEMEKMYKLKVVYPATLGDLWTKVVEELAREQSD